MLQSPMDIRNNVLLNIIIEALLLERLFATAELDLRLCCNQYPHY